MNIVYLTPRYSRGFFNQRLREIFQTSDPGCSLTILPADTTNQEVVDEADLVFTETVDSAVNFIHGVFMPCNAAQIPATWESNQRDKIDYYIITSLSARTKTARYGLSVSALIPSPLCWLPPKHDADYRGLVLHFPRMRDWESEQVSKLILYTVDSFARDNDDLSDYTIVAECDPFEYRSQHGENVIFTDNDGSHFWHLLHARVLVSMSHDDTMEMVFAKEAAMTYNLPLIIRSESLMHPKFTPTTMLGKMAQPRSYSDIKSGLVVQDWYYRAVSERVPFIDIGSGIENSNPHGKICFTLDEYQKLLGPSCAKKDWEENLVRAQQANKELMLEKMTKLINRVKEA